MTARDYIRKALLRTIWPQSAAQVLGRNAGAARAALGAELRAMVADGTVRQSAEHHAGAVIQVFRLHVSDITEYGR